MEDTRYQYNELGWLTSVTVVVKNGVELSAADQEKTTYGYDLQGRAVRMTMPNGVIEDKTLDKMGRITQIKQFRRDGAQGGQYVDTQLAEFKYSMDAAGQRTRAEETFWLDDDDNASTPLTSFLTKYDWTYDADNRLTKEKFDSFDNSLDRTDNFTMDLFGNRLRKTTDFALTTAADEAIAYMFDGNDRLTSEKKYDHIPLDWAQAIPSQTTTYTWNGTQQASKSVSVPSVSTVVQNFTYDLKGMLSSVVTVTKNEEDIVTSRTKVDYGYTSTGIRSIAIDWIDANLDGTFAASEKSGSTEYLIDSSNFTGYAQTIAETTKNASGQVTKRIVYTFGTDEITQTTTDYSGGLPSASAILHFGHDAHGSVRVLFNAATAIAQVYTYAAYGELLAVHNGVANLQPPTSSLTSVLYNGESFDSRIGQLYLRARWYDMHRFTTLDPYSGNASDPLSFNKFGFVHANPVMGIDPSGKFLVTISLAIAGFSAGQMRSQKNSADIAAGKTVTSTIQFFTRWKWYQIAGTFFGLLAAAYIPRNKGYWWNVSSADEDYARNLTDEKPDSVISENNRAAIDAASTVTNRMRMLEVLRVVRNEQYPAFGIDTCFGFRENLVQSIKRLGTQAYDNDEYVIKRIQWKFDPEVGLWEDHFGLVVISKSSNTRVAYFDNGSFGDSQLYSWPALTGGVFQNAPNTLFWANVKEVDVMDLDD